MQLAADVQRWLIHRDFNRLLIHLFNRRCFLCSFVGVGHGLQVHLIQQHKCHERGLTMLVQQIVHLLSLMMVAVCTAKDLILKPAGSALTQVSILALPILEQYQILDRQESHHAPRLGHWTPEVRRIRSRGQTRQTSVAN